MKFEYDADLGDKLKTGHIHRNDTQHVVRSDAHNGLGAILGHRTFECPEGLYVLILTLRPMSKNLSHGLRATNEREKIGHCRWQCCVSLQVNTSPHVHCGNLKNRMAPQR